MALKQSLVIFFFGFLFLDQYQGHFTDFHDLEIDVLLKAVPSLVRWSSRMIFRHQEDVDLMFIGSNGPYRELLRVMSENPAIGIDTDQTNSEDIAKLVHDHSRAVIILSRVKTETNIDELFRLIKFQSQSLVLLFGNLHPHELNWNETFIEKHLIYIRINAILNEAAIYMFCPKHRNIGPVLLNVWKFGVQRREILGKMQSCPHVLSQENLTISFNNMEPFAYKDASTGKLIGADVEILKILAEKFEFSYHLIPAIRTPKGDDYSNKFLNSGTSFQKLNFWEATFSIGYRCLTSGIGFYGDFGFLSVIEHRFVTRIPQKKTSYFQLIKVFSPGVWALLYALLTTLSIALAVTYKTYKKLQLENLLRQTHISWADFVIMPLARFVEPDPIPWFQRWSTGRLLVLSWSFFTMMMIFFFSSNLRAILMKEELEMRINHPKDVLESGRKIYMSSVSLMFDHKDPQYGGYMSSELRQISEKVYADKTWRERSKRLLSDELRTEVMEEGSIFLSIYDLIMYDFIIYKHMKIRGFKNFVMSDYAHTMHCGFQFRKHSPYGEEVILFLSQLRAMGFFEKFRMQPIPIEARVQWTSKMKIPKESPLTMEQLALTFFLVATGLILASVVFIMETIKR